jgi:hypothetical protein
MVADRVSRDLIASCQERKTRDYRHPLTTRGSSAPARPRSPASTCPRALARMEGEVGLRALAERFPDLHLLPGADRRPTRVLRGYQTLPARLR